MPFSIKNIFSNSKGSYPEISGPVQDKPVSKNCTLISTTCSIKDYTVFNIKSCGFDIRPPGTGDRTPQLKFSASELSWLSKTTETEIHNTKE
ncbi:secretion protein EspO [Escherichia albertii]|uniref:secretion protein EspO n=1 Tax=Escherichia albertii TaxID=208962 RepID=UPI000F61BA5A|nr:secretion protein EspO [Escherichia albertii]EFZ2304875.1 secretion protein EspO [Shigella boydii]EFG1229502.1 secretion protein EspO [Escherichia albertii]EFZ6211026.1 secretion protein EspO [Shigella boydii]EFZ6297781.1 secretion protein EspO [Shigella boydii]EFZ6326091.1 secretion protein EspO [Shigella boydii]